MIVRLARPEDDARIGQLLVDAFRSAYARKLPEVVMREERRTALLDVGARREVAAMLVLEDEGRVVGTVALFPPGAPGSEAWFPDAADLRQLATDPALHGRGLSRLLLDEAERIARDDWRCAAVCLHTRRGVQGVARLYQARGYVRAPEGDLDTAAVYLEGYLLRFRA